MSKIEDKEIGQLIAGVAATMSAIFLALLSARKLLQEVNVANLFPISALVAIAGIFSLLAAGFVIDYFMDLRSERKIGKPELNEENPFKEYYRRVRFLGGAYLCLSLSFGFVLFVLVAILFDSSLEYFYAGENVPIEWRQRTFGFSGACGGFLFTKLFSYHKHWPDVLITVAVGIGTYFLGLQL